ncbi:MAG: cytochrome c [Armatimonadetes bacterium]|nr:cytochrome c [Armatimonadota bacterium]
MSAPRTRLLVRSHLCLPVLLGLAAFLGLAGCGESTPGGETGAAAPTAPPTASTGSGPADPTQVTPASEGKPTDGPGLFGHHCSGCHGPQGQGAQDAGPALTGRANRTEAELRKLFKEGKGLMPALGDQLSEEDLQKLIPFVQGLGKGS